MPVPKALTDADLKDAPDGDWKSSILRFMSALRDSVSSGADTQEPSLVVKQVFIPDEWVRLKTRPGVAYYNDSVTDNAVYFPPMIRKTDDGCVELVGLLWSTAGMPVGSVVIQYNETAFPSNMSPNDMLPAYQVLDIASTGGPNAYARLDITKSGTVYVTDGIAVNHFYSINIRYPAADRTPPTRLSAPIVLQYDFGGKRCADVRCVDAVNVNSQSQPLPEPRLAWTDNGDGTVSIRNVLGLPPNQKYNLTFEMVPE